MTTNSCRYSDRTVPLQPKGCRPNRARNEELAFWPDSRNLDLERLCRRIAEIGNSDRERVYGYVVRSIRPRGGEYVQTGSAPNVNGGLITLCTCKHSMRASMTPEQWKQGVWIAGLTSWDQDFNKQQSLVYLMRVGEAYESQSDLVRELRNTGRSAVVDAKDATRHPFGDLMMPVREQLSGAHRFLPSSYFPPMLGHSHRQSVADEGWEDDINYLGPGGRQAAMLVGDPNFSFLWTHPMVRRRRPGHTRPYREWTLAAFLDDIDAVPL